ncbi:MAG TPA: FAD-dependent oxidoreductase [Gammaproteobacteria bacterium]|nr:FAD-dependent oxidoreductase [Gammaproteobacteria bacterium]
MQHEYDVVVIGGGIHGAGVAQAAAAGGHRVLAVEQAASLAAGTSSRSSKLIHGGLRYLETAQLHLVARSLRERALLLRLAPELVKLRPFYVPVYRSSRRPAWEIGVGLSLYALLGGLGRVNRFHRVPRRDWDGLDGLRTEGLEAVFRYQDAQTDDAALTRAVMRSAQSLGAELQLETRFVGAEIGPQGVVVRLAGGAGEREYTAAALVNAAGPWVEQVLGGIEPAPPRLPIELVQGSHLVLDATLGAGIYYLEAPADGRAVLAMPWQGRLLLGTTEVPYAGDPAQVHPTGEERRYLLDVLGHYFPDWYNPPPPLLEAFAGLRVLPAGSGRPFSRPRETRFVTDHSPRVRLVSIYGGKLTTYRWAAAAALRRVAGALPERRAVADTARLPLEPD